MKKTGVLLFLLAGILSVSGQAISDSVDVTHYAIHLDEINTGAGTISGHTEVHLTSADGLLTGAALQLTTLEVDSVKIDGAPVPFTYNGALIRVPFNEGIMPGEAVTLDIYYHGAPFSEVWGGFHFAGNNAFNLGVGFESIPHNLGKAWFPCVDDFTDRATYEFYVTADNPKVAVCGGVLQGQYENGDKTTFHWQMEQSIPTYLASVAIGEYELYEDTFEGTEQDIPIQIWVRPQELAAVEGSFVNLHDILTVYEERWGPYPFSRIGLVSTSKGAMEHATNIAYPYGTINGNTTYEWLYAHELAHMWFGNKITCASAQEMWLNEGWAVFNEFLFREGIYGPGSWEEEYNDLHNEVLHFAHTPSGDGDYYALNDVPQEVTYGSTSYDKGGIVVHTLRNYLGDETFFPAMQAFLTEYAYQPASSEDLMNFLSQETGRDMTPFFQNWVFTPGFPHFEIDSVTEAGGSHRVFVQQKSKAREVLFDDNIIEVFFMDEAWQLWSDTMSVSGAQSDKVFEVPFAPVMTMLDFENLMADATTDEEHIITAPTTINSTNTSVVIDVEAVSDSAFLRVTHHWAAPDTMDTPVEHLRLSDYRYWLIDGVDMDQLTASCRFYYNKNNYLDHTLLLDEEDEITLLYRPDQYTEWQEIAHNQIGPASIGYLEIDVLAEGEYTLAVWEDGATNIREEDSSQELLTWPNPAKDLVTISLTQNKAGVLQFLDQNGKTISRQNIPAGRSHLRWNTKEIAAGIYFIQWIPADGKTTTKKVIIRK